MSDGIRVLAGDCTVRYDDADGRDRTQRGAVLVVAKPDNTVLVHDAGGYRPAAWLTRADAVRSARDPDGFRLVATRGDQRLVVEAHDARGEDCFPASPAGTAVGDHPGCGGSLVRDGDRVVCVACGASWRLPRDATVLDEPCPDCGLPRIQAARGAPFEVCLDRDCESLDAAVAERFDGEWPCPDCGTGLEIRRSRGLRAVCPDCERAHRVPTGTVAGTCDCGLPRFDAGDGPQCLDSDCEHEHARAG